MTIVDMGDLPESHVSISESYDKSYDVAATRAGGDAQGGQGEVLTETSVALYVLWHAHRVRHVSACGALPLGVGPVMAEPSVVVHRLEGHAAGLDGPYSRSS